MQYYKELKTDNTLKVYSAAVEKDEYDKLWKSKLAVAAMDVQLPGFRKGKVPANVLIKKFGNEISAQTNNELIQKVLGQLIEDTKFEFVTQPKIENVKNDDEKGFSFEMHLEIMPEIDEELASKGSFVKKVVEVDQKAKDEFVSRLLKENKTFTEKDAESADGDRVDFDFVGMMDGVAFEGGSAQGFKLVLGSGNFIPGFEEQLIGLKAGDKKEVNVSFPEDYHVAELAGKPAVFNCLINAVESGADSELNDEFVKKFGFENLAAFDDAVNSQLNQQNDGMSRSLLKKEVLDYLDKTYKFDLSKDIVDFEFNIIWENLLKARENDSLEEDDKNKSDEELEKTYRELADRRVRLGIVLTKLATKNGITVSEDEVNNVIMAEARNYPGKEREVISYYDSNPTLKSQIRGPILEEKVVNHIVENSDVKEETVSQEKLTELVEA